VLALAVLAPRVGVAESLAAGRTFVQRLQQFVVKTCQNSEYELRSRKKVSHKWHYNKIVHYSLHFKIVY
jgi:hypothetical protein